MSPFFHAFRSIAIQLSRSQSGSVLPLIALCMIIIIGAIGLAIDLSRAQIVQSRLQYAADAAALAAGARLSELASENANNNDAIEAEVERFMAVNFPSGLLGATLDNVNIDIIVPGNHASLTVTASVRVPTTLMKLLNRDSIPVSVRSKVGRVPRALELVLVLDNTHSVVGSKLAGLKTASLNLIDLLFAENATRDNLFVGIVPFSTTVNIGTANPDWVNWSGLQASVRTGWGGCVLARDYGSGIAYDTTDTTYDIEKFRPFYNDYSATGVNYPCPRPITRLTNVKATLTSAIGAMIARGHTQINLGAVWGWRLLSPNWQDKWGGEMDTNYQPVVYNTPKMDKVVVVMSDGRNDYPYENYGGYGPFVDGVLGNSYSAMNREADARLLTVCGAMKSAGIIVFSIAFDADGDAATSLMANCATSSDHAFTSSNAEDLLSNFIHIGNALNDLRLVE